MYQDANNEFRAGRRAIRQQRDLSRPLGPPAARALQQYRRREPLQGSARSAIRRTRRPISASRSSARTASTTRPSQWDAKALELDPKLVEAHELMANLALEDSDTAAGRRASRRGDRACPATRSTPWPFTRPSKFWPIARPMPGSRRSAQVNPDLRRGLRARRASPGAQPSLRGRHRLLPQGHRARSASSGPRARSWAST